MTLDYNRIKNINILTQLKKNKDAMITSGGRNLGCMKLVGEAFRESGYMLNLNEKKRVVVLSIGSWTTTRGNETLLLANVSKTLNLKEFKNIKFSFFSY
jgi:hypothetical protein